jgi:hypothetical protein
MAFESAAWYWHFVDVVAFLIYLCIFLGEHGIKRKGPFLRGFAKKRKKEEKGKERKSFFWVFSNFSKKKTRKLPGKGGEEFLKKEKRKFFWLNFSLFFDVNLNLKIFLPLQNFFF